jgi:hypothetical protein
VSLPLCHTCLRGNGPSVHQHRAALQRHCAALQRHRAVA